jgi:group I intron endonuclease
MNNTINNNGSFVPVILYNNADINKLLILKNNKEKVGIYMWTHLESGKRYIGSAYDLTNRFDDYFRKSYISDKSKGNNYIYNALLIHGYSKFSLSILEYIDISNLSSEEAREKILLREQYFLDCIFSEDELNTYNILKVAGSLLGFRHTNESKVLMSKAKAGDNNHNYGKSFSENIKALMSEAKTGENHPMYSKNHHPETLTKMSITKGGGIIYVYNVDKSLLVNSFPSARKAAEHFNCNHSTIKKYTLNGEIFKEEWILSLSANEK